jgi:hypothetical protein
MRRSVRWAVVLATLTGMLAALVPLTGVAATTSSPRWILHIQRYSGGISGGVRAMISDEARNARARYGSTAGATGPAIYGTPNQNLQMNTDSNPPMPQNETAVAYSLDNPLIAVAAANDYVSGGNVVMFTKDGGQSWGTTRVTPQFRGTGDFCTGGDPSVAYSLRDHAFYMSQLCFFRSLAYSEVHVFKSLDNGKTWTPGRQAAVAATNFNYTTFEVDDSIFNDKEYIAVDNTPNSPRYGRLYVTYTKFHIQPDGFSDYCPIQLSYTDTVPTQNPNLTVFQHTAVVPDNPGGNGKGRTADQFSVPVVEKNGTLDIAYLSEECNTSLDHHLFMQKSTNGGASFLASPVRVDAPGEFVDNPSLSDLLPPKKFRVPNTIAMAYSQATGTLAYVYTNYDQMNTSGGNIEAKRSIDGGLNWSAGQVISTSGNGSPARNDQFFPWIAANPSGQFFAIWLDCRRDPNNHDIDTFQATSGDDALSWTDTRISTESWDPDFGFFTSGSFIGDYSGLAAANGVVYPVWTDGRDSAIQSTGIGETDIFTNVEIKAQG